METNENRMTLRNEVLRGLGASDAERIQLLAYNENRFDHSRLSRLSHLPAPDEPFVNAWERYEKESLQKGAFETLKSHLVQFCFPIQKGISETAFYRSATRKGILPQNIPEATGLQLKHPERFRFHIRNTLAGRIPILITGHRDDFVSVLRALTRKNEPEKIPSATGAMMVSGYNNWDRVHTLKAGWKNDHPEDAEGLGWSLAFQEIRRNKHLYQDKFILLSDGPYSDVAARDLGLSNDRWKEISLTIRREHECTHYVTKTLLGSMQNRLLDELIADYMGLVAGVGRFRADWFLRFMGLEGFPRYRAGGRLENYRGDPPLTENAFRLLGTLVEKAARNLEAFDGQYGRRPRGTDDRRKVFLALTRLTVEEMASEHGAEIFHERIHDGTHGHTL